MGLIAEFHIDHSLLQSSLAEFPDVMVEVEQHATDASGTPYMILWTSGNPDFEAFEATLDREETLVDWTALGDPIDDRRLYRIELPEAPVYWRMVELEGVLLGATGTTQGWDIRARFPDREALAEYRQFCLEEEYGFTLKALYQSAAFESDHGYGLTDGQREMLTAAYDGGYFDVPRRMTVGQLSEKFRISDQAVSERIRRGLSALLRNTLVE